MLSKGGHGQSEAHMAASAAPTPAEHSERGSLRQTRALPS